MPNGCTNPVPDSASKRRARGELISEIHVHYLPKFPHKSHEFAPCITSRIQFAASNLRGESDTALQAVVKKSWIDLFHPFDIA